MKEQDPIHREVRGNWRNRFEKALRPVLQAIAVVASPKK